MLRFLRRGDKSSPDSAAEQDTPLPSKGNLLQKLSKRLTKTSQALGDGLGRLLLGKKEIDDELLEEIETQLLMADIGIDTTQRIMSKLAGGIQRQALLDSDALYQQLKDELALTLKPSKQNFTVDCSKGPFVISVSYTHLTLPTILLV